MPNTFGDRIDLLKDAVGHGLLKGVVDVDQIYAHYQEVDESLDHPRGGEAYALRNSSVGKSDEHMQTLADSLLTEDGSDLVKGMTKVVEDISDTYAVKAPREFGDLEGSAHPTVVDDGATVYDRPPKVERLTEEELKLKHRGLDHRDPHHGPRERLPRK